MSNNIDNRVGSNLPSVALVSSKTVSDTTSKMNSIRLQPIDCQSARSLASRVSARDRIFATTCSGLYRLLRITLLASAAIGMAVLLTHFGIALPAFGLFGISLNFAVLSFCIGCVDYCIYAGLKHLLAHNQNDLIKKLTDQSIRTLKAFLKINEPRLEKLKYNYPAYSTNLEEIRQSIRSSDLPRFYRAFNAIAYVEKEKDFSSFILELAVELNEHVDGIAAYQAIGTKYLPSKGNYSTRLEKSIKNSASFHRNSGIAYIFWALFHPDEVCSSIRSKFLGTDYKCVETGNMISKGWAFDGPDGKKIYALFSPGTFDPIIDIYHQSITEPAHLMHHGLQHPSKKGEGPRVEAAVNLQSPSILVSHTPMDGPLWNKKGPQDPAEFLENYHQNLLISINPPQVPIIDKAIDCAKQIFSAKSQKKCDSRMMQMTVQALICLGEMFDQMERMKSDSGMIRIACKQMIDRGATMACAMRVLYLMEKNGKIAEQELQEIAGVLAGRAILVENRQPLKGRYKPFLDMLDELPLIDQLPNILHSMRPD